MTITVSGSAKFQQEVDGLRIRLAKDGGEFLAKAKEYFADSELQASIIGEYLSRAAKGRGAVLDNVQLAEAKMDSKGNPIKPDSAIKVAEVMANGLDKPGNSLA